MLIDSEFEGQELFLKRSSQYKLPYQLLVDDKCHVIKTETIQESTDCGSVRRSSCDDTSTSRQSCSAGADVSSRTDDDEGPVSSDYQWMPPVNHVVGQQVDECRQLQRVPSTGQKELAFNHISTITPPYDGGIAQSLTDDSWDYFLPLRWNAYEDINWGAASGYQDLRMTLVTSSHSVNEEVKRGTSIQSRSQDLVVNSTGVVDRYIDTLTVLLDRSTIAVPLGSC